MDFKKAMGGYSQPMAEKQLVEQLVDLNNRSNELRRHVVQISNQIANAEQEQEIMKVTIQSLEATPEGTKTYQSVGKMFIVEDKQGLIDQMKESVEALKGEAESRRKLRDQFVAKYNECEVQKDELLNQIEKARASK